MRILDCELGQSDRAVIQASAYRVVRDDDLDALAERAVRLAFNAGRLFDAETVLPEHRDAILAMSTGVAERLRERCGVYESVLRTVSIPESAQSHLEDTRRGHRIPGSRKLRVREVGNG
jgi:hypothetical protein